MHACSWAWGSQTTSVPSVATNQYQRGEPDVPPDCRVPPAVEAARAWLSWASTSEASRALTMRTTTTAITR